MFILVANYEIKIMGRDHLFINPKSILDKDKKRSLNRLPEKIDC